MTGANLTRSWLRKANLTGVNLSAANLTEAKLGGADLTHANLSESILAQVNLSHIKLAEGHPRGVICTNALLWETTMPDGTFIASPKYHE